MKKIAIGLLAGVLVFSMLSCGSKETPEETTTPEAPVVEETTETPETTEEVPPVIEEVIKTVDNTAAMKSMELARGKALEAGADKTEPDYLAQIDALCDAVKSAAEGGADVSKESADIAKLYEALALYISAKDAKATIDDTKMFNLAQGVYDDGCKALDEATALLDDENATAQQILDKTTVASTKLNAVLVVIYKQVARDAREDAKTAKNKADSVKAAVSQKEKYDEAVELFKKADSLYSMQSVKKATENYKASEEGFMKLFNDISEKRAAVQKAIEEAKAKVAESASFAEAADAEAPLTEKVEGIEDEDAVLLESDSYADPEAAEADLPETLAEPSLIDQIENTGNNIGNAITNIMEGK
ncbi:MAG: hypothetical protein MJ162_01410 [Treponema sp.]|nr:hypothetical protein [Treponema sp.]